VIRTSHIPIDVIRFRREQLKREIRVCLWKYLSLLLAFFVLKEIREKIAQCDVQMSMMQFCTEYVLNKNKLFMLYMKSLEYIYILTNVIIVVGGREKKNGKKKEKIVQASHLRVYLIRVYIFFLSNQQRRLWIMIAKSRRRGYRLPMGEIRHQ
jgi:hypothetical protein